MYCGSILVCSLPHTLLKPPYNGFTHSIFQKRIASEGGIYPCHVYYQSSFDPDSDQTRNCVPTQIIQHLTIHRVHYADQLHVKPFVPIDLAV